jgi:hypothetical protein
MLLIQLMKLGFSHDEAKVIESLTETYWERPKTFEELEVDKSVIDGLMRDGFIFESEIKEYTDKKYVTIGYRLRPLDIAVKKKLTEWHHLIKEIDETADRVLNENAELIKLMRSGGKRRHTQTKKVQIEKEEVRAKKSLNYYEYRAYIEKWKSDLLKGVARRGKPPREIIEWKKTVDLSKVKKKPSRHYYGKKVYEAMDYMYDGKSL